MHLRHLNHWKVCRKGPCSCLSVIKSKTSEVLFEDIVATLDRFFITTPHPMLETQKFYQRKQKPDESITMYIAALRKISAHCAFRKLERRIIEQIILGVWYAERIVENEVARHDLQ